MMEVRLNKPRFLEGNLVTYCNSICNQEEFYEDHSLGNIDREWELCTVQR
jgi:hypothetical protein